MLAKRLLITTFTFPPQRNGVSHVVEAHAYGLARLGYDITVATGLEPAAQSFTYPPNVHVARFDVWGSGRRFRAGGYHGDIEGYQRFIREFDGDAILCHAWQIWSSDLAIQAFTRVRAKKVMISHGFNAASIRPTLRSAFNWLCWRSYVRELPEMLKAFDHSVFLTDRSDRRSFYDHGMIKRLGLKHYSVIPNGVYLDRFETAATHAQGFRERLGIGRRPMILNVSNYMDGKNQEMAVRAFMRPDMKDAVLVLIGSEINDYARSVQNICQSLKKPGQDSKQVFFLERQSQEDVAAAYCAADLFVCPSRHEVQPLVILEAIASGTPFISTDVGCVRDIPGGIIVKNVAEMADTMVMLLNDRERRDTLKNAGTQAARSLYNWQVVIKRYDALLERLCARRC